jgi:hypothetical protein
VSFDFLLEWNYSRREIFNPAYHHADDGANLIVNGTSFFHHNNHRFFFALFITRFNGTRKLKSKGILHEACFMMAQHAVITTHSSRLAKYVKEIIQQRKSRLNKQKFKSDTSWAWATAMPTIAARRNVSLTAMSFCL